jgi:hypothetical protein
MTHVAADVLGVGVRAKPQAALDDHLFVYGIRRSGARLPLFVYMAIMCGYFKPMSYVHMTCTLLPFWHAVCSTVFPARVPGGERWGGWVGATARRECFQHLPHIPGGGLFSVQIIGFLTGQNPLSRESLLREWSLFTRGTERAQTLVKRIDIPKPPLVGASTVWVLPIDWRPGFEHRLDLPSHHGPASVLESPRPPALSSSGGGGGGGWQQPPCDARCVSC